MAALIQPAPFMRRIAAAFYDALLLMALWIACAFAALLIRGGEPPPPGNWTFQIVLVVIGALFNGWFWTHGGQTLGMRAWRLQIREVDSTTVGWPRSFLRFLIAIFSWGLAGVGVLFALIHPENKTLHDLLSGTETVLLPPPEKPIPIEG